MDGQMSIFDFPQYLPETDFETMTIKEAAEIISGRTGLKFELAKSFNENKETYSAKKKGLEIRIEFANYADGVRDGIRHLGVDYSFGTGGGAKPCESIDEAVEYIQEKIDSLISAAVPVKEPKQIIINDYEWHSIDTPPQEGQYCEFEYAWSMYHTNDRKGICTGWWVNGKVQWENMPMDIGRKTLVRWRRRVEGLKPNLFNVVCEHDHKALCNRWHGGDEEIAKAKSDLIKGFSCSGCCYYCSQAPMHGGKCKHECRYFEEE